MAHTSEKILDIAEEMMMKRGYNAFSYHDISRVLDIKTASIHYHFPKKETLGRRAVERYASRLADMLAEIEVMDVSESKKLATYVSGLQMMSDDGVRICLCGALAAEMPSLPEALRTDVQAFFEMHETWLQKLLNRGRKGGEFEFSGSAKALAKMMFAMYQGALITTRERGGPKVFKEMAASVGALLRAN